MLSTVEDPAKDNCLQGYDSCLIAQIGLHIMSVNSTVNTLRSNFSLEVVCIQISDHDLDFQKLGSAK